MSHTPVRRRIATRFAAVAVAISGFTMIAAAPASAAPIGDGAWAPSHDQTTQVIPLCKGPGAVAAWLNVNFSDHGKDINAYIKRNTGVLTALASGKNNTVTSSILLTQAVAQIPSYAISDAVFHLPATALSVATGCGTISKTGINPFAILGR